MTIKLSGQNQSNFLFFFLDQNLTWKQHIKYIEKKCKKNIGLLSKTKPFLNKQSLLSLYYSYLIATLTMSTWLAEVYI